MPHAEINNDAGFGFESLFVSDLNGAPLLVTLVQAVFSITGDGELVWMQEQPAVQLAGRWLGDPATTSLVLEPQIAFRKLGTDIVLHGFAYPAQPGDSRSQVGIRVGELRKVCACLRRSENLQDRRRCFGYGPRTLRTYSPCLRALFRRLGPSPRGSELALVRCGEPCRRRVL